MDNFWEIANNAFAFDAGVFVHLAALGYMLGFLFKNQITLRVLVMLGTFFYIVYYYSYPVEPLWGAILGSALIIVANTIGLARLLFDRLPIRIKPAHRSIFETLINIQPGDFRQLMRAGTLHSTDASVVLTDQNVKPACLHYVIEGQAHASRNGEHFKIPAGRFIGEVSFVLDGEASATVVLPAGGSYMSWAWEPLRKTLEKNPKLQQAFEANIGRDLAAKLAKSKPQAGTG